MKQFCIFLVVLLQFLPLQVKRVGVYLTFLIVWRMLFSFLLNVLCHRFVFNLVIFSREWSILCRNQWLFVFLDSVVNWLCYCTSYSIFRISEVLIMGCFCGLHWCWSHHSFVAMVSYNHMLLSKTLYNYCLCTKMQSVTEFIKLILSGLAGDF